MTLLIIIHILICVFLVCVILLQPGKSDGGIGFGGSSSQSIFGSRGAGNFLTKTTSVCALVFLATSFVLTRSRIKEYTGSVIGKEPSTPPASAPAKSGTSTEPLKDAVKGGAASAPADAKAPAGDTKKETGAAPATDKAPVPSKAGTTESKPVDGSTQDTKKK